MSEEENIISALEELTSLALITTTKNATNESLLASLSDKINDLINNEFAALVQLLYRLDIPENKLKQLLQDSTGNHAEVIARIIIERQVQKTKTRKAFKKNEDIDEDEKW